MMFKGVVENKAKAPDTITDSDGKTYRRADFEDAGRPGFTRPGLLFSSLELQLCGKWGLVAPSGFSFAAHLPVERPRDPAVISGSETPPELRAKLAAAEQARAAWMRRRGELFEAGLRATERWQLAARNRDAAAYDSALAQELQVAEQLRDIADEEPKLVKEIAKASAAIRHWQYLERLRRTEAAAR